MTAYELYDRILKIYLRKPTALLTTSVLLVVLGMFAKPSAQAQTYSVLYSFTGSGGDDANLGAGVIMEPGYSGADHLG
jgi:hypothetical protein